MPVAEILDGPPEWAGTQFESPEEDMAEEIGLIYPRWRGTPVWVAGERCMPTERLRWRVTGTATAMWGTVSRGNGHGRVRLLRPASVRPLVRPCAGG